MKTLTLNETKKVVKITYDDFVENPREYNDMTSMYCEHHRYDLGDDNIKIDNEDCNSWDDIENKLKEEYDIVCIMPVSLYDHSGLSMSTGVSHGWDCGQVGFIFMTRKQAEEYFGFIGKITAPQMKKLESVLESEVETYSQYLEGDVKCIELFDVFTDEDGHTVEDMTDCIGGFYLNKDYTAEMAIKEHFGLEVGEYELQED